MKKPKRKSSIYKDKNGYSYYQTYTFFNSLDGKKKKVQKSIPASYNKSQIKNESDLWDDFYNQIDENYKSKNPFQKPPTPLSLISQKFMDEHIKKEKIGDISTSTLRIHRENLNLFKRWFLNEYSDRNVHRITTAEIDEYRTYRRKLNLSDNTIRINLRTVRTFFAWCLKNNYIEYTPFTEDIDIPSYKKRSGEEIPLGRDWNKLYGFIDKSISYKTKGTEGEEKFRKFNENDWFKYVIYIMCNTGMRPGEVRILKWKKGKRDSTSQRHSYSYLNKDFSKIHIFFKGSYGEIPSTTKLKKLFHQLSKSRANNTYVFQSPVTELYYDKSIFNKMFRKLCVNLNMVDSDGKNLYVPHSIRHSVVSNLLKQNVSIGKISTLLRHSSIRTTMDIYGHLLPKDLENVMEKIGEVL